MVAHCRIEIRQVAKATAGHLYERVMGDHRVYEEWCRQNPDADPRELERRFIEKNWTKCTPTRVRA